MALVPWLISPSIRRGLPPRTELKARWRGTCRLVGGPLLRCARDAAARGENGAAVARQVGESQRTIGLLVGLGRFQLSLEQALEPAIELGAAAIARRTSFCPLQLALPGGQATRTWK